MSATVSGAVSEAEVRHAVESVRDPELPVLTLADLGVLREVRLLERRVLVRLTPTYVACPALGAIKHDVRRAVARLGLETDIEVVLTPPWHPGLITRRGRERLLAAGIAPPTTSGEPTDLGMPQVPEPAAQCPRCGQAGARLVSARGPTPCTSIHVCPGCAEPFEKVRDR